MDYDDDFSATELEFKEKQVEPDKKISGRFASRNIQLANYDESDYELIHWLHSEGRDLMKIPFKEGGFLTQEFGSDLMTDIDFIALASGGKEGFVRKQINTARNINIEKEEQSNKKGVLEKFKPKNNDEGY